MATSTAAAAEVPAFWEDQLFSAEERTAVRFRIGEVNFEAAILARAVRSPRDPHTGVIIPGFQKSSAITAARIFRLVPRSPLRPLLPSRHQHARRFQ